MFSKEKKNLLKNKNWIFTPLSKWYSKSVWTSMLYECLMYQRALWHLNTLKLDVLYSRPSRLSSFSIVVVNVVSMLKMWLKMRQRPKSILSKNAFLLLALAILWLNATCTLEYLISVQHLIIVHSGKLGLYPYRTRIK